MPETLRRARVIALRNGVRYAYVGNVHDPEADSTFCPGCGQQVISRDWYEIHAYRLQGGGCEACGTPIAGRFEDQPGTWGRRRLPIRIGG